MSTTLRPLVWLAQEALRDALRRRLVLVVVAVALLGLAAAESCTAFGDESLVVNDVEIDSVTLAGWLAPVLYGAEALALVWMAGLLAADHLARPLGDGTATLVLARPVGRGSYALARLLGALGVAGAAGALLLGGTAALLIGRHGLAAGPALVGAGVTALAATCVAALAMTASLALGRVAVSALVGLGVPLVVLANGLAQAGVELRGVLGAVDRLAPPLGRAVTAAVAPWNPTLETAPGLAWAPGVELALWSAASVALLTLAFRRVELPG